MYYLWGIARPCITSHFSCLFYCIFVIPLCLCVCVCVCVFVSLFGSTVMLTQGKTGGAVNTLAYLDTCVYECVCLSDLMLLGNCVWIVDHPITKLNFIWLNDSITSRLKVWMFCEAWQKSVSNLTVRSILKMYSISAYKKNIICSPRLRWFNPKYSKRAILWNNTTILNNCCLS